MSANYYIIISYPWLSITWRSQQLGIIPILIVINLIYNGYFVLFVNVMASHLISYHVYGVGKHIFHRLQTRVQCSLRAGTAGCWLINCFYTSIHYTALMVLSGRKCCWPRAKNSKKNRYRGLRAFVSALINFVGISLYLFIYRVCSVFTFLKSLLRACCQCPGIMIHIVHWIIIRITIYTKIIINDNETPRPHYTICFNCGKNVMRLSGYILSSFIQFPLRIHSYTAFNFFILLSFNFLTFVTL